MPMLSEVDYEPNLYVCPRCRWTTDIGGDDAAGDETAVALRIAHECASACPRCGGYLSPPGAAECAYCADDAPGTPPRS